jgi:hypothetical protein
MSGVLQGRVIPVTVPRTFWGRKQEEKVTNSQHDRPKGGITYSVPRAMTKYCACVGPGFLMPCSSFEAT